MVVDGHGSCGVFFEKRTSLCRNKRFLLHSSTFDFFCQASQLPGACFQIRSLVGSTSVVQTRCRLVGYCGKLSKLLLFALVSVKRLTSKVYVRTMADQEIKQDKSGDNHSDGGEK
jgi:hypothetical protein